MAHTPVLGQPPQRKLYERLELVVDWYAGMISRRTGRLCYRYEPDEETTIAEGSPIREIASIWDVQVISRFLGRGELLGLVERSLRHYTGYLVSRGGARILDSACLGEPAGIAHNALMILALYHSDLEDRRATIGQLAEGIVRQQREDGSYGIYFDTLADDGLAFYPGEAMLALMEAYTLSGYRRYLASVERGFTHYRQRFPPENVAESLRVFHANWQARYAERLHARTKDDAHRAAARDYAFALHDRIRRDGFYEDLERHPRGQATIEVACALEGLNAAYTIAERTGETARVRAYEQCIRTALEWLLCAQSLREETPRERGGFGYSLNDRTQRIDVTGHAARGLIASLRNGLEP